MPTKTFDAVVIGAGPGGYVAAIRLAQLGKKTALVEKEALGGVCLNWGCIPSKALIAAANLVEDVRGAAERGIVADGAVDVAKLREFKNVVVKKMIGGVGLLEKGNGVEVVRGTARFVAPNAVEVKGADGEPTPGGGAGLHRGDRRPAHRDPGLRVRREGRLEREGGGGPPRGPEAARLHRRRRHRDGARDGLRQARLAGDVRGGAPRRSSPASIRRRCGSSRRGSGSAAGPSS